MVIAILKDFNLQARANVSDHEDPLDEQLHPNFIRLRKSEVCQVLLQAQVWVDCLYTSAFVRKSFDVVLECEYFCPCLRLKPVMNGLFFGFHVAVSQRRHWVTGRLKSCSNRSVSHVFVGVMPCLTSCYRTQ